MPRNLIKSVGADGSIKMENRIEVYAPVLGRMEKLLVTEGDRVRKGQRLAVMSSSTRTTLLDMAGDKGKEEKEYWEKQILPTAIFSPASGQVIHINVAVGENIKGSVLSISTGKLIRTDIDESDISNIRVDQPVKIVFDIAPSKHFMGKVTKIAKNSRTVNNVNVYRVQIEWDEEETKKLSFNIKFGMSVTLQLEISKKMNTPSLPVSAVNGLFSTTIDAFDNELHPIKLKLGEIYGEYVEVLSGAPKDRIVKVAAFVNQKDQIRRTPLLLDKK